MHKTTSQARQEIRDEVNRFLNIAALKLGVNIEGVTVDFNLTGRTMGTAQAGAVKKLRFNLTALQVEGGWDHLFNHTVGHEVAHLVQYLNPAWPKDRRANPPHGAYWKTVMRAFGLKAQRCHSVALPKARVQRKWAYTCGCGPHNVSTTLHKRMLRGGRYRCGKCKSEIVK